ncbi:MAG TPA: bifunctional methylenetetrahydrofolate dehydrogenase/methenyltetrahydrofolate cyclohydrolase FolD [Thermoleophilaceae bacterium]|nr:bifunctional methylenetetrahydrofolate dehydrogenase/methenyltetrahydrofolate cyclohydrolase FolD [Thermoleophilaceae bacterium]
MTTVIDGKAVAADVRARVAADVEEFVAEHGVRPGLATVLVGDDPASHVYVRNKRKASEEVGISSIHHELPASTSQEELAELLAALNEDDVVSGILLQLPVPDQIDGDAMTALIDPLKDVDGLTPVSAGRLMQGLDGLVPCTPRGVMELLRVTGVELTGARAVVVGRSKLVGKPLAALLLAENCTVVQCHSRTRDLADECRRADVLVAAAGVPKMIGAGMVREGAVVIDVGINRGDDGKLVGDVDFEAVKDVAAAITPVPGGVGPMTIAMLLSNTLDAARRQLSARAAA